MILGKGGFKSKVDRWSTIHLVIFSVKALRGSQTTSLSLTHSPLTRGGRLYLAWLLWWMPYVLKRILHLKLTEKSERKTTEHYLQHLNLLAYFQPQGRVLGSINNEE